MYLLVRWVTAVALVIETGSRSVSLPPDLEPRKALREEANRLYSSGDLPQALALFQQGITEATKANDPRDLSRFHGGIGLCHLARTQYDKALAAFQDSRKWAKRAIRFPKQPDLYAAAAVNLATAYGRMGDYDSSKRAIRDGLAAKPGPQMDALLRLNLAICHTEDGPPEEADRLLYDLIARMRASKNEVALGRALERLGYHLTKTNRRLPEAEAALLESVSIRERLGNAEKADPYFVLAQLRLAQQRPEQAMADLEHYAASGRKHYWSGRVHNMRGQILEVSGQPERALSEFREAVVAMRRRRSHIRLAERFLRVSELALPELYENFIRLASFLHKRSGNEVYLAEAIAASEEIRVTFQREAYYSPEKWADQHAAYRDLLAQLDQWEARGVAPTDPRVDRVHLALVDYEARMAQDEPLLIPPTIDPATHLPRLREAVDADEAVFVFHVTDQTSLGWMVTRERVIAAQLPPAAELRESIGRFCKRLKQKGDGAHAEGLELFTKIFREFSAAGSTKLHWTFVLDGPLFEVPWTALPLPETAEDQGRKPVLVDRHAISLLPSFFPERQPGRKETNKLFAGVGDPVYNAADPRFVGPPPPVTSELARLPGSAEEVQRSADVWAKDGYRSEILLGRNASTPELLKAVGRQPAVLHLATHVVAGPDAEVRLAFSLNQGRPDLLGARELSQFRLPGAMVMMAGCASGKGRPQPVGLVSLTRAWLLSGATGVVATLWPVPDDQGDFPTRFYERVSEITKKNNKSIQRSHRLAWARALRQAVVEARDSGNLPASTWAGYYLMGRN